MIHLNYFKQGQLLCIKTPLVTFDDFFCFSFLIENLFYIRKLDCFGKVSFDCDLGIKAWNLVGLTIYVRLKSLRQADIFIFNNYSILF